MTKFILTSFHFVIYVRLILEMFLYSMLSCISELARVESLGDHKASYSISVAFIFLVGAFVTLLLLFYKYSKDVSKSRFFSEFFSDFKPNTFAKLYNMVFLLRRFIIVLLIVFLKDINDTLRLSIYTSLQVIVTICCIIVRPFENIHGNFVEIFNDSIYSVTCGIVIILSYKETRHKLIERSLIYIVIANGVVVCMVNLIYLISLIIQYS